MTNAQNSRDIMNAGFGIASMVNKWKDDEATAENRKSTLALNERQVGVSEGKLQDDRDKQNRALEAQNRTKKYATGIITGVQAFRDSQAAGDPNPNYVPGAPPINDPDWDPIDYAAAEGVAALHFANQEGIRKQMQQSQMDQINDAHKTIVATLDQASGYMGGLQPDIPSAKRAYQRAYEAMPDGNRMEYGDDGKSYKVVGPDGTFQGFSFDTEAAMMLDIKTKAEQALNKEAFTGMMQQNRQKLASYNQMRNGKATYFNGPDEQVARKTTGKTNTGTGEVYKDLFEVWDGTEGNAGAAIISEEEFNNRQFVPLAEAGAIADIKKKNADATKVRGGTKSTPHNLQKLAEVYEKYETKADGSRISKKDSLRMAENNQSIKERLDLFQKAIDKDGIFLGDPKDEPQVRNLLKSLKLEEWWDQRGGSTAGGPGVGDADAVATELADAFPDAKDGTTKYDGDVKYTKKKGKWVKG